MQQCVLFIIAVEVPSILYCMHFLGCPNSLIPFGSKIPIEWRFYFAGNYMDIVRIWTVIVYKGAVCTPKHPVRFSSYLTENCEVQTESLYNTGSNNVISI